LGLSLEQAAEGMIRVVNANMVKGIRVVSVAKGHDPRDFCLVAFGGAGPLHALELAAELNIPRVLAPIAPGATSALGLLTSDLRHDYVRTQLQPLRALLAADLAIAYAELEQEALAQMARERVDPAQIVLLHTAELRYLGQGYELETAVSFSPDAEGAFTEHREPDLLALRQAFQESHRRQYGYIHEHGEIELVNLRLSVIGRLPGPQLAKELLDGSTNPAHAVKARRPVYMAGCYHDTPIYDRTQLRPGDCVDGPAVIEQLDSTTLLWPSQQAMVDGYRNLLIQVSTSPIPVPTQQSHSKVAP
jgi:N-methylhydantoinase A